MPDPVTSYPIYTFVGSEEEIDVGLSARTGFEGPQVLLRWNETATDQDGVRIVRRFRHYPEHETDGVVVFERDSRPEKTYHADLGVLPGEVYYYAVFHRLDSVWYKPYEGSEDWAFSGGPAHFVVDDTVATTVAAGSSLASWGTSLTVDGATGLVAGDWVRIGTTAKLDVLLTAVNGAVLSFEARGIGSLEATILEGDSVQRLKRIGPAFAEMVYSQLYPKAFRRADETEVKQGIILQPVELADGQTIAAGEPGLQYSFRRWVRLLVVFLARAHAAAAALPKLYDLEEAPTDFLRQLAPGLWNYYPPQHVESWRVRSLVRNQPGLVRRRGVETSLVRQVQIVTGEEPAHVYGRDRVVRVTDPNTGVGSTGQGLITALSAYSLTDAFASWEVDEWVGAKVKPSPLSGQTYTVISNTATVLNTDPADGDMTSNAVCITGTSDAPTEVIGLSLDFDSSAQTITRPSGSWITDGYDDGRQFEVIGADAANNGFFEVQSRTALVLTITGSFGTTESGVTGAIVRGGVVNGALFDVSAPFSGSLLGRYVIPDTTDTGAPGGAPRAFVLTAAGTTKRVESAGKGSLIGPGAVGGDAYRVCDQYQIVAPYGGRLDPRLSMYDPTPASAFNERGHWLYLATQLDSETEATLRERMKDMRRETALEIWADGGGDGSLDYQHIALN